MKFIFEGCIVQIIVYIFAVVPYLPILGGGLWWGLSYANFAGSTPVFLLAMLLNY